MYPIDPSTLVPLAHPAARKQLLRIIPDHVKLLRLPLPDSDRDMAVMRLEAAVGAVREQTNLLDRLQLQDDHTYLDPVTGGSFHRKNVEQALERAADTLFWLRVQLLLNDSWRAADIVAALRPSTQLDRDEADRLAGPLYVPGLAPLPELKNAVIPARAAE